MAKHITTLAELEEYISVIMGKTIGTEEHTPHAPDVAEVLVVVVGCLLIYADLSTLKVRQYNGKMANMIWFESKFNDDLFCLAYDHHNSAIKISKRVHTAPEEASWSSGNSLDQIHQDFRRIIGAS